MYHHWQLLPYLEFQKSTSLKLHCVLCLVMLSLSCDFVIFTLIQIRTSLPALLASVLVGLETTGKGKGGGPVRFLGGGRTFFAVLGG